MAGITRRGIVRQLALCSAFSVGLTVSRRASASKTVYDLSDPSDNVEAALRLMSDIAGHQSYFFSSGRLFGQLAGEKAVPLFRIDGLDISRLERLARDVYRRHYLNAVLIRDLYTNEVAEGQWRNPFTGEHVRPKHMFVGPGTTILSPRGYVSEEIYDAGIDAQTGEPFIWDWRESGDTIWSTRDVLTKTPVQNPPSGRKHNITTEFQTYRAKLSEFRDPNLTSVPCTMTMTARFNWFPWMEMGDREGSIIWHSVGRKFKSVSDLPASFVAELETRWPNVIQKPEEAKTQ